MAKITIWDMDYYYAKIRKNVFNSFAMKISSYHKQLGDEINFVRSKNDLHRPYDRYYIFKEHEDIPDLIEFLLDTSGKIFWYGHGVPTSRCNLNLDDKILGCRPDYLLYTEKDTKFERAEQVRFTNTQGKPLEWIQTWDNTFKNKLVLVLDEHLWENNQSVILKALKTLENKKSIFFLEPIPIEKILSDKEIREQFLKLKIARVKNSIRWTPMDISRTCGNKTINDTLSSLNFIKTNFHIAADGLYIKWTNLLWYQDHLSPLTIFSMIQNWCIEANKNHIHLMLERPPKEWRENPKYSSDYIFFNYVILWASTSFDPWLGWLSQLFCHSYDPYVITKFWNTPSQWPSTFRLCLMKTAEYKKFLEFSCNNTSSARYVNDVMIPWAKWKEQFKYEI